MFLAYLSVKFLWNGELFGGTQTISQQICQVLVAFVIPISDTSTVFINRIARGQSPFVGGKDHTTHHLSYLGLSDSQVGFVYLGVNLFSILLSIAIFRFIDLWKGYHTLGFVAYFLIVFVTLFAISQMNKDKRI